MTSYPWSLEFAFYRQHLLHSCFGRFLVASSGGFIWRGEKSSRDDRNVLWICLQMLVFDISNPLLIEHQLSFTQKNPLINYPTPGQSTTVSEV